MGGEMAQAGLPTILVVGPLKTSSLLKEELQPVGL